MAICFSKAAKILTFTLSGIIITFVYWVIMYKIRFYPGWKLCKLITAKKIKISLKAQKKY